MIAQALVQALQLKLMLLMSAIAQAVGQTTIAHKQEAIAKPCSRHCFCVSGYCSSYCSYWYCSS